jgi:hypothetical protein
MAIEYLCERRETRRLELLMHHGVQVSVVDRRL